MQQKKTAAKKKGSKGDSLKKERRKTCDRWTEEEKERLVEAVEIYGQRSWNEIAKHVGTKNSDQCNQHWHRVLNPRISKDPWAAEEDALLTERVAEFGESAWKKVSEGFEGRTDIQCRHRWIMLVRTGKATELKAVAPKKPKAVVERASRQHARTASEKPLSPPPRASSAVTRQKLKKRTLSSDSESWTEEEEDEDETEILPRHKTRHQTRALAAAIAASSEPHPKQETAHSAPAQLLAPFVFPPPQGQPKTAGKQLPPSLFRVHSPPGGLSDSWTFPSATTPPPTETDRFNDGTSTILPDRFNELCLELEEELATQTNDGASEFGDFTTEGSPHFAPLPSPTRRSSLPSIDNSHGLDPMRFKRRQSLPFLAPSEPPTHSSPSESPNTIPRAPFFSGRSHRQKVRVRETPSPDSQAGLPPPIFLGTAAKAPTDSSRPRRVSISVTSPVYSPRTWGETTHTDPWQWRGDAETNSDSYLSDSREDTEGYESSHATEDTIPVILSPDAANLSLADLPSPRQVGPSSQEPEVDPLPVSLESLSMGQDDDEGWTIYDIDGSVIKQGELRVGKGEEAIHAYFVEPTAFESILFESAPQDSPSAGSRRVTPHSTSEDPQHKPASNYLSVPTQWGSFLHPTTVAISVRNDSQPKSQEMDDFLLDPQVLSPIALNDICSPISSLDPSFEFDQHRGIVSPIPQ